MGKHDHKEPCEHENLAYCKKCDVVYCKKCDREWGKPWDYWYPHTWASGTVSVPTVWTPDTYYLDDRESSTDACTHLLRVK